MFKRANYLTYLGFKLFSKEIEKKKYKYFELDRNLKKAMIEMPPEMYVATAKMFSFLFGIIGALLGLIFAIILVNIVGVPPRSELQSQKNTRTSGCSTDHSYTLVFFRSSSHSHFTI